MRIFKKTAPALSLAACLMALSAGSPAFAHAYLKQSAPAAGSVIAHAPQTLLMTFTEDLEVPFCTVLVTDSMGMSEAEGKPQAVPGRPDQLQVKLHITMPGKVTVLWHALSTDTHKTKGSFSFTVSQ